MQDKVSYCPAPLGRGATPYNSLTSTQQSSNDNVDSDDDADADAADDGVVGLHAVTRRWSGVLQWR